MTKTQTPFFSLGSRGTIGNVLTTQKRGPLTIVRRKPTPAYRFTLSQAYQRWLFGDYKDWWLDQSAEDQIIWRTTAAASNMTGYSLWMRNRLKLLPDIIAWWRLDKRTGIIAPDSSLNQNNGIIFGASDIDGLIDGALLFDGLNDRINCGHDTSLDLTSDFTIETFIYLDDKTAERDILCKRPFVNNEGWVLLMVNGSSAPYFFMWTGSWQGVLCTQQISLLTWTHLAITKSGTLVSHFIDGDFINSANLVGTPVITTADLYLGAWHQKNQHYFPGRLDNPILRNRVLTDVDIKRHSQRRHPL